MRRFAEEHEIDVESILPDRDGLRLVVSLPSGEVARFEDELASRYPEVAVADRDEGMLAVAFTAEERQRLESEISDRVLQIIEQRTRMMGIRRAELTLSDGSSILVRMSGVRDPDRMLDPLSRTGRLEFRVVEDQPSEFLPTIRESLPEGVTIEREVGAGPGGAAVTAWYLLANERRLLEEVRDEIGRAGGLPPGTAMAFEEVSARGGSNHRTYLVSRHPGLTGDHLRDARVVVDQEQVRMPYIDIEFDREGTRILDELTRPNVGRRLAIILEGNVNSAPVIMEPLDDGRVAIIPNRIDYEEMLRETNDLALVLRSGALPASVRVMETGVLEN